MNSTTAASHRRNTSTNTNGNRRRRRRKNRQQQDVVLSSHYDRSRIEKELDLFFGCDEDDEAVDVVDVVVVDTTTTTATEHHSPRPYGSNNHKSSSSLSLLSPSPLHLPLSSQSNYGKSFIVGRSITRELDPIFDLDDPTPGRCDTDDFDFLSIMEKEGMKIKTVSSSDVDDKQPLSKQGKEMLPPQSQPQPPQPSQSKQYPESDIDGFSVIEQMPIPERKMIISYSPHAHHQLAAADRPPELLTISMESMDSTSMAPSHKTASTSKSHISYDESTAITPSISFFLSANKEELQNEGLSIAGGDCNASSFSVSPRSARNNHNHNHNNNNNNSNNHIYSNSNLSGDESQTARGYSRGSSKFTTDSPRILELRERKRLMERFHERKYNKFPALIEVDKFST
mmetsp:Transcript_11086/g.13998  ORF Transcript_11086/g.13998 Transcript_11086/m.13998 type:complete len:399 (-) Transcript_11086:97-1293(-)|eukprot:CAMPEP_0203683316 /NCGR_PEP_ID=MMETSP0090-20130426/47459_1 /ASSEMBLY_ACC=CAM_ASM_001088 /TAXON_ID=426623 /ORGANISM="Chaetoceros affinis, Strain CCMP159" /LENGTH=398 /DNA_ID=CAMNT_0050552457 /DNA_START=1570 /DNA_END=2766 /DNA_ORIENTATION=+